jgi:hypothetical protein
VDSLESHDEYLDLLERVPTALSWCLLEERESGYDVWMRNTLQDGYFFVGFLDAERLRLGVARVVSGLTRVPHELTYLHIKTSHPRELSDAALDVLTQAALWGELRC